MVIKVNARSMTAEAFTAAMQATASKTGPDDIDPFEAGDNVVYRAHGVGRIDKIGYEDIAGHRLHLIAVTFAETRMTLRIPVAGARAAGLRKLADRETWSRVERILGGRKVPSRLLWSRRAAECLDKINSGDLVQVASVVRDLQGPPPASGRSTGLRTLFDLALDRLAGEFAAVNGTDKEDAVRRLTGSLRDMRAPVLADSTLPA